MRTIQNLPPRGHRRLTLLSTILMLAVGASATPPLITNITVLPNREIELQLVVTKGQSYIFEVSTNLVQWQDVGGLENAPTNFLTVVDEEPADTTNARFYRMREGLYQRFDIGLMHFAQGGSFSGGATSPATSFPIVYSGYKAIFDVEGGAPYPEPTQVLFTGPSGTGLSASPGSTENWGAGEWGAWYHSIEVPSTTGAPAGIWTVNYKGVDRTYLVDLQPLTRLVIPVPTAHVANGVLQSVSWVYKNRETGATLSGSPAYMANIQVQIDGQAGRVYDSPYDADPAQTTHTLESIVNWADVRGFNLAYDDPEDNHFVIFFHRTP